VAEGIGLTKDRFSGLPPSVIVPASILGASHFQAAKASFEFKRSPPNFERLCRRRSRSHASRRPGSHRLDKFLRGGNLEKARILVAQEMPAGRLVSDRNLFLAVVGVRQSRKDRWGNRIHGLLKETTPEAINALGPRIAVGDAHRDRRESGSDDSKELGLTESNPSRPIKKRRD